MNGAGYKEDARMRDTEHHPSANGTNNPSHLYMNRQSAPFYPPRGAPVNLQPSARDIAQTVLKLAEELQLRPAQQVAVPVHDETKLKSKLDRVANINQFQQRYIANLTRENVQLRERIESYESLQSSHMLSLLKRTPAFGAELLSQSIPQQHLPEIAAPQVSSTMAEDSTSRYSMPSQYHEEVAAPQRQVTRKPAIVDDDDDEYVVTTKGQQRKTAPSANESMVSTRFGGGSRGGRQGTGEDNHQRMRMGQPRGGRGGRPTFEERQNNERFEGNRGGYQRGGMMMGGGGRGQNRCEDDFDRMNRGGQKGRGAGGFQRNFEDNRGDGARGGRRPMDGGRGGRRGGDFKRDMHPQRNGPPRIYNNEDHNERRCEYNKDTKSVDNSAEEKWKKFCELEASKPQESCQVSALKDSTPIQSPSKLQQRDRRTNERHIYRFNPEHKKLLPCDSEGHMLDQAEESNIDHYLAQREQQMKQEEDMDILRDFKMDLDAKPTIPEGCSEDGLNSAMRMDEIEGEILCHFEEEGHLHHHTQSAVFHSEANQFLIDTEDPHSLFIQPIWTTAQPQREVEPMLTKDHFSNEEQDMCEEEDPCKQESCIPNAELACKSEPAAYPFAQEGPYHALQECSEDDPHFLLKLCSLIPEPSYVPTFLRLEEEQRHKRLASELPFEPIENLSEAIIYPLEKQVGNLVEVAEAVLTLCAQEEEGVTQNIDVLSEEGEDNCCDENRQEYMQQECCYEAEQDCQQSPVKGQIEEGRCSVVEQQAPENEEDQAAESPMPKYMCQAQVEEMRYMHDVPVYSEDEDDCGGDWDAVAPPMFPAPEEEEDMPQPPAASQKNAVACEDTEDEFVIRPAARVRRIESPPKCAEPVPVVAAPAAKKKARINQPDTPQVSFYRKRFEQAMKFQDIQTLAEVVFEIKCAELEDWFDIEAAEELIFND
ncbi:hypothetical protein FGO68_gene14850 [Halteria grandinella]|uniref:Uncharacterized protein n=1 Tax=Halteria grandinella TaxID=5974 RepID=A0A8J8P324_HALGN|nr:hypothetical protein FGO68_gene14850 [Halteria grandinella]